MTDDRPDGIELLEAARAAVLGELLPELPEARRYTALMIAGALAIATREWAAGSAPAQAERRGLAAILGAPGEPAELEPLRRRLADALRRGEHDGARAVHRHLLESCLARTRVSNPKELAILDPPPKDD